MRLKIKHKLKLHSWICTGPRTGKAARLREMDGVATVGYRSKPLFLENNYSQVDRRCTLTSKIPAVTNVSADNANIKAAIQCLLLQSGDQFITSQKAG